MKKDPIVGEVRKHREEHAKKFKYDLKKIFADHQESEKKRKELQNKVAENISAYSVKNKSKTRT